MKTFAAVFIAMSLLTVLGCQDKPEPPKTAPTAAATAAPSAAKPAAPKAAGGW
jgi:hypothetical protein